MTIAEDMIDDAITDMFAPCGHCDKQYHQMSLTTLYTEDESQHDTFCDECIKECAHELWVAEDN